MEIGPRTILVFLVVAFVRGHESGDIVCFIETLMILNALQWVYKLSGYLMGEENEQIAMNFLRRCERRLLDILIMAKDTIVVTILWLWYLTRGQTFPPIEQV